MDFATWVQSQIDKFGITIYQISRRSGVHASTIANWLNGAKPQDAKAKAVKIAVDEIIKEKQALSSGSLPPEGAKKAPDPEIEGVMEDEDLKEAVELLKKMDKETLRIFIKAARGALEN